MEAQIDEANKSSFSVNQNVLSKNALKRLKKQETREESALEWKKKQKAKRKENRALRKNITMTSNPDKLHIIRDNVSVTGKVAIDLSFMELMNEKELKSFASQVMRCYSLNRRFSSRFCLSLIEVTDQRLGTLKRLLPNMEKWDVEISYSTLKELNSSDSIVYLTADSSVCLSSIEDDKVYVVGGLVDHNRFKRACVDKAENHNITTARLPILENINLAGSKVLTIVNVYEILLRFKELKNWKEALHLSIPKRKIHLTE